MESLLADVRYAFRLLTRAPGFTFAVVLVLALGIGSNSAIFTVLDKTVIRPLPYANPDRLAMLWEDYSALGKNSRNRVSPATFLDWHKRTQTFEEIAAYGIREMDLSGGGPPERVLGARITSNLIPTLGVPPFLGRNFTAEEQQPGAKLVVLSYRLWQRRYGGNPNMVGDSILMSGEKYTVIGVMPRGFHYPARETEFWTPFDLDPQLLSLRNSHFLYVVGRLKPGRDRSQAQSDMNALARQLATTLPWRSAPAHRRQQEF